MVAGERRTDRATRTVPGVHAGGTSFCAQGPSGESEPTVWDFLTNLFASSSFVRRRACGAWSQGLIRLHNLSDAAIWLAYLAIPVVLVYFVRRRKDVPFKGVFLLFGAFIVLCGLPQ